MNFQLSAVLADRVPNTISLSFLYNYTSVCIDSAELIILFCREAVSSCPPFCFGRTSQQQRACAGSGEEAEADCGHLRDFCYDCDSYNGNVLSTQKNFGRVSFFNSSCCLFIYYDVFLDAACIVSLNKGYKN